MSWRELLRFLGGVFGHTKSLRRAVPSAQLHRRNRQLWALGLVIARYGRWVPLWVATEAAGRDFVAGKEVACQVRPVQRVREVQRLGDTGTDVAPLRRVSFGSKGLLGAAGRIGKAFLVVSRADRLLVRLVSRERCTGYNAGRLVAR